MTRFFDWTPSDDWGYVFDVTTEAGWTTIRNFYAPDRRDAPLERVIEIAKAHGVVSVLCEYRYIDLDYRSEHSQFYSTTFRRYPSVCHRLHFFVEPVDLQVHNLAGLENSYRGYSIMRPLPGSPVGRTMIAPPPELSDAYLALAHDSVHLLGRTLTVTGAPFMSQDAQYLRCAHAAQWMTLYHSYLHGWTGRRVPSEIQESSRGGVVTGREIPSEGLSPFQMLEGLSAAGLSPGHIPLPESRAESRTRGRFSLEAVLCRYINSNFPPIVTSNSHAWVVVGYTLDPSDSSVTFVRNDDARGPYIVADPWNEPETAHKPWVLAITPLPRKVYVSAETAEVLGAELLTDLIGGSADLGRLVNEDRLTFRTFAVESSNLKATIERGHLPDDVKWAYQLAAWPRYVWVIEAVDRQLRSNQQPDVVGEVILDATAHHEATVTTAGLSLAMRSVLSIRFGELLVTTTPDYETSSQHATSFTPSVSFCDVARRA